VIKLATYGMATRHRDLLKLEFGAAPPLREIYPQLAEVRVEFEFEDGTTRAPSDLAFTYVPAAHGFFRYACPCHICNGEFDLTSQVAGLADRAGNQRRSSRVSLSCTGQRVQDSGDVGNCPVNARIRLVVLHAPQQES
jgi:hypothetical protein